MAHKFELKVSIIIPVIRPEKAKRCIQACLENAGIPGTEFEILSEVDTNRIGVAKMVKQLTLKTRGEMVCFLGDDTIPQKDFLKNALKAMAAIPHGWGLVSFNDNPNTTRSAAHWVAHKKLLPLLDGEFFHTGYKHCFCDDELLIRCQMLNRYIYAYDAVVYHEHPKVHKEVPSDESYDKIHSDEWYKVDEELFHARSQNDWRTPAPVPVEAKSADKPQTKAPLKVLIGVPSGDMIHTDFAMNLVTMCMTTQVKGIRVGVVNPKFSLVQVGRCDIIATAKQLKADKVFFLDSDMLFPPETLLRLLSHNLPIVGCDALRRREPFTPVVMGMDGKPLNHTPEIETLVELKGGSQACQLIDMSVFEKLKEPYFHVEWNEDTKSFLGEDYYFSNKVRAAGFKIMCDTKLSQFIGHIGVKPYYLKDEKKPV